MRYESPYRKYQRTASRNTSGGNRKPVNEPDPVWVGGQERPAFLWQARTLSENWACDWHVEPGRQHFDVIDDLADPDSGLVATLLGGL